MSSLSVDTAGLVIVDVQERFAPAIAGWEQIVERSAILARAASLTGMPIVATEQYPKGLGPTVEPVAAALGDSPVLEKTVFPASAAEGFDLGGRTQALICGVETHVCVLQTAIALSEAGVEVHLAVDATGSRHQVDRETAIERMALGGVTLTTVEAAGFELLGSAENPSFRDFQALIK